MERYKCKLCFKRFSNGRALGGHMRSHVMMMDLTHQEPPRTSEHTDSASSPSSLSSPFEQQQRENTHHANDDNQRAYVLRENPRKSIRLADLGFSFNKNMSGSAFVEDIESETESSKNDPTRRRSIRTRNNNSNAFIRGHQIETRKKMKLETASCKNESWMELEPVHSSISSVTTEEDVAYCLMMLSRDKWKTNKQKQSKQGDGEDEEEEGEEVDDDEEEEEEEEDLEEYEVCRRRSGRGKYKCETCNKGFKSYQALGGHRASHMKMKLSTSHHKAIMSSHEVENVADSKIQEYECPYCFRVFSSGQALGGHKRSHGPGGGLNNNNIAVPETKVKKVMEISMIDLNLPAPVDDDDNGGEFELSAVSNSANR